MAARNVSQKLLTSLKAVSSPRNYFTYTPEPAQPIKGKEPKWTTAEEAFQDLKSGIIKLLFIAHIFYVYFLS